MPENKDSLPILDDIIIPGDADKADKDPVSNTQDSLWDNNESSRNASATLYQPQTGQLPDIEALTEQLVDDILPELEQLLREKIRQRLLVHFTKSTNDT